MPDTPVTKADLAVLGGQIEALTAAFEATETFAQETRDIARNSEEANDKANATNRVVLLLGLAVVILAGFGFYLLDSNRDSRRLIDLQREYDVSSCERANSVRAGQRKQWTDTRELLIRAGAGKETRRFADDLVANANKNFPPLDCEQVRRGLDPAASPLPTGVTPGPLTTTPGASAPPG